MCVHRCIIRSFGGNLNIGVFFEHLLFLSDKATGDEGWIFKSGRECEEETFLGPGVQRHAAVYLQKIGLLEMEVRPHSQGGRVTYYRLILPKCREWVERAVEGFGDPRKGQRTVRTSAVPLEKAVSGDLNRETPSPAVLSNEEPVLSNEERRSTNPYAHLRGTWPDPHGLTHGQPGGDAESGVSTAGTEAASPHLHTPEPLGPTPAPPEAEPCPFFAAVVEVCQLDTSDMALGDGYSRGIGAAVAGLREREGQPADVLAFGRWWREHHMRNGSPPEVRQIVPNWLRFRAWQKEARKRNAPLPAAPMVAEVKALSAAALRETQARSREELARVQSARKEGANGQARGSPARNRPRSASRAIEARTGRDPPAVGEGATVAYGG